VPRKVTVFFPKHIVYIPTDCVGDPQNDGKDREPGRTQEANDGREEGETLPRFERRLERKSTGLRNQEKVVVNTSNTRIATVTTDYSTRLQQLWKEPTGEQLWVHEQKHDSRWKAYPSFSPDGKYVGFHDGESHILLLNTNFPAASLVATIDLGLFLSRPVESFASFAVGLEGHCVAIAAIHQASEVVVNYNTNDSFVQIVPIAAEQSAPELCYTPDGKTLYLTKLLWTFNHGWSLSGRRWRRHLMRTVEIFDSTSGDRKYPSVSIRKVVQSEAVCGIVRHGKEYSLVLDVTDNKPGDRLFGFLWRARERKVDRKALVVSSSGRLIGSFLLTHPGRQMIVSHGIITLVDSDGEVRTWDGKGVVSESLVWSRGRQHIDGQVVAFNEGRITLLFKGEFTSMDTVPA